MMYQVNICIPTLNSYDTLYKCIESIQKSTVRVDNIYIIDNGCNFEYSGEAPVTIYKVPSNVGVAASWNKFITQTDEVRIICNDDIEFTTTAIAEMIGSYDENNLVFPEGVPAINAFSCFLLPQKIINSVGLFDEKISPNYGYFEDNDYHRRMLLAGFGIKTCSAHVSHVSSSTLKHYTTAEMNAHHKKFKIAESRYRLKWGGLPGAEKLEVPREL